MKVINTPSVQYQSSTLREKVRERNPQMIHAPGLKKGVSKLWTGLFKQLKDANFDFAPDQLISNLPEKSLKSSEKLFTKASIENKTVHIKEGKVCEQHPNNRVFEVLMERATALVDYKNLSESERDEFIKQLINFFGSKGFNFRDTGTVISFKKEKQLIGEMILSYAESLDKKLLSEVRPEVAHESSEPIDDIERQLDKNMIQKIGKKKQDNDQASSAMDDDLSNNMYANSYIHARKTQTGCNRYFMFALGAISMVIGLRATIEKGGDLITLGKSKAEERLKQHDDLVGNITNHANITNVAETYGATEEMYTTLSETVNTNSTNLTTSKEDQNLINSKAIVKKLIFEKLMFDDFKLAVAVEKAMQQHAMAQTFYQQITDLQEENSVLVYRLKQLEKSLEKANNIISKLENKVGNLTNHLLDLLNNSKSTVEIIDNICNFVEDKKLIMKINVIKNSCVVIDDLDESIDRADTYVDENLIRLLGETIDQNTSENNSSSAFYGSIDTGNTAIDQNKSAIENSNLVNLTEWDDAMEWEEKWPTTIEEWETVLNKLSEQNPDSFIALSQNSTFSPHFTSRILPYLKNPKSVIGTNINKAERLAQELIDRVVESDQVATINLFKDLKSKLNHAPNKNNNLANKIDQLKSHPKELRESVKIAMDMIEEILTDNLTYLDKGTMSLVWGSIGIFAIFNVIQASRYCNDGEVPNFVEEIDVLNPKYGDIGVGDHFNKNVGKQMINGGTCDREQNFNQISNFYEQEIQELDQSVKTKNKESFSRSTFTMSILDSLSETVKGGDFIALINSLALNHIIRIQNGITKDEIEEVDQIFLGMANDTIKLATDIYAENDTILKEGKLLDKKMFEAFQAYNTHREKFSNDTRKICNDFVHDKEKDYPWIKDIIINENLITTLSQRGNNKHLDTGFQAYHHTHKHIWSNDKSAATEVEPSPIEYAQAYYDELQSNPISTLGDANSELPIEIDSDSSVNLESKGWKEKLKTPPENILSIMTIASIVTIPLVLLSRINEKYTARTGSSIDAARTNMLQVKKNLQDRCLGDKWQENNMAKAYGNTINEVWPLKGPNHATSVLTH